MNTRILLWGAGGGGVPHEPVGDDGDNDRAEAAEFSWLRDVHHAGIKKSVSVAVIWILTSTQRCEIAIFAGRNFGRRRVIF